MTPQQQMEASVERLRTQKEAQDAAISQRDDIVDAEIVCVSQKFRWRRCVTLGNQWELPSVGSGGEGTRAQRSPDIPEALPRRRFPGRRTEKTGKYL